MWSYNYRRTERTYRRTYNQANALAQTLDAEGLAHDDSYFRVGYDSPWAYQRWPYMRRNEIWIPSL